jgi:hypothetical protein
MNESGFFTAFLPHRLPHPVVPLRIILATHAALCKAFGILRTNPPVGFRLESALEDEITRQLHSLLEDRLLSTNEVSGFDRRRIRNVVRAPEISNHDGSHPAKKPDLVLFLLKRERYSVQASQDAVFAECKPVDDTHAIGQHYCDQGIMRFINGEYAWAMQDGLMVGYVRGNRTISSTLSPALAARDRHGRLGSPTPPAAFSPKEDNPLHRTEHARNFMWTIGQKACSISLYHSWHACG